MHEDPIQYELDLTERVESMFINDTHLFLGLCNLPTNPPAAVVSPKISVAAGQGRCVLHQRLEVGY